jgi:hypothetical protein
MCLCLSVVTDLQKICSYPCFLYLLLDDPLYACVCSFAGLGGSILALILCFIVAVAKKVEWNKCSISWVV